MKLDEVFFLLLDTIDMSQSMSVGIFLLIMNRRNRNSLLFLGIFLVASGLGALSDIFHSFSTYINTPYLHILSFNFLWLLPTLLYLYVEHVSVGTVKRIKYALLIPGIIDFILNLGKFLLPESTQNSVENSVPYALFLLAGAIWGLTFIGLVFAKVRKHTKLIKDQYSSLENKELKWIYVTIVCIISLLILGAVMEVFFSNFFSELILSLFGLFITFWVAYNGILQQAAVSLIQDESTVTPPHSELTEKITVSDDKDEKQTAVVDKVKNLLTNEKLYLNPELTIIQISDKIGEHPRTVSGSINRVCQENFNRFINKYRVEEAKKLLRDKNSELLNMEGIGSEAGFKSNSSFYNAFKKELNVTPLQYLKKRSL